MWHSCKTFRCLKREKYSPGNCSALLDIESVNRFLTYTQGTSLVGSNPLCSSGNEKHIGQVIERVRLGGSS